ncbi:MAG: OmpH family outer membrane protein [Pyrinomonadaceae bacterium]
MKIIRTLASAILLATAAFSTQAQTRPAPTATPASRPAATPIPGTSPPTVAVPAGKIAIVDTEVFADEKIGIARLVGVVQSLQREVKPKNDEMLAIQTRMQQIAKDIETMSKASVVDPKSVQAKQEEGTRLERDLKYKKEDFDAMVQRRYREVVGPVSENIGKELDAFATQHGITMVLDVSKMLPAILTVKREMDVTLAFIAYYNARNPATAAATTPR